MEDLKEIPVLLLTGYLGSGKTTLVNRILNNRRGIRFAVIVNDLGEVNIDADLIAKGGVVGKKDDSLVALQNGCICCTLKTDLIEQLCEITSRQTFDYIVIEASGICEPEPIAQTICSIPSLGYLYVKNGIPILDCVVTVVDALRMRDEFAEGASLRKPNLDEEDLESLVIQQIEFCNIIVLNKASDVAPEELGRIKAIIRTLQPKAKILEADYCNIELDDILDTGMFQFDDVASSAAWIQAVEGHEDEDEDDDDDDDHDHDHDHDHEHEHGHHHHHHHEGEGEAEEYGIGTFVYQARRPFDLNCFDNFVAKKWPKNVIRAKGICYFSEEFDNCYLFEQAGRQFVLKNIGQWFATMPEDELIEKLREQPDLLRDWDSEYGDRMQKLVFIGQHLDGDFLKRELDNCLFE
ncbi:MAG: GTP-binding protein [Bacteroidales bacterium]|nr:GTP-binding protein [Bacteroidales bacterium]